MHCQQTMSGPFSLYPEYLNHGVSSDSGLDVSEKASPTSWLAIPSFPIFSLEIRRNLLLNGAHPPGLNQQRDTGARLH